MTLPLFLASPLRAQDKPAVAVTCQLDTTDETKTYSMDVMVDPAKNLFKIKIVSWFKTDHFDAPEIVIEETNDSFNGQWSDLQVIGDKQGSKSLILTGGAYFITRADQKRVTEAFTVQLVQTVHPEDGTRAAGVIFLGVNQLASEFSPLLPDGVSLAGPGNCWKTKGVDAYL